jgi:hypothetical protein
VSRVDRVSEAAATSRQPRNPLKRWFLKGYVREPEGPYEAPHSHATKPWWQVMCLTGVDYFSTLGYQPGIAALAAGALSPIATLVLVLLTLFGALPMYRWVARESPHGDGSISMLEHLLPWWPGKLFVLMLIGFAATGFVVTITLSAADAAAHIIENPFAPAFLHGGQVIITLLLITLLGAVFLKGFGEAIGIAVLLVAAYISLNLVVLAAGAAEVLQRPEVLTNWRQALFQTHGNPLVMLAAALLVFPKLALGLSGFETGVMVMPLVKGDPRDTEEKPEGRIRNTGKLLTTAALIMSVLLVGSSLMTTLLIPPEEFRESGEAYGRALAFLAHDLLGGAFGTIYDISTILILWFAGASAMAGLLNIVPRYLPRYGMAPDWTRATRPLVVIYTLVCFVVTLAFRASVTAQAGAYATGVLFLMTSATIAVTLSALRARQQTAALGFGVVALIFVYTTLSNVIEQPSGIQIAVFFIVGVLAVSLISRVYRTTELRITRVALDEAAQRLLDDALRASSDGLHVIANKRQAGDETEYLSKAREQRRDNRIPPGQPVIFFEVDVDDASEFTDDLEVKGLRVGDHCVLRAQAQAAPNAIAAFLLHVRDRTGVRPHGYFSWTEGNPVLYLLKYFLSGEGDTAPVTHEILRRVEPQPERRPVIHASG